MDGALLTLPPALLRGDPRLLALFAPFRECVVLHESLIHEGSAARGSRLLMAEIRRDEIDAVRAVVRGVCPGASFEEKPTDRDDVAGGTEWRERSGAFAVSAYRLFGGSTALHVTTVKTEPVDAALSALRDSPLAVLADLANATSFVDHLTCTRSAGEPESWHLQATLRDLRRFEEIAPELLALGFEDRRGKHWREQVITQPVGKNRWMAAFPGVALGA